MDFINNIDMSVSRACSFIGGYIEEYTKISSNWLGYYIWCLGSFIMIIDFILNFELSFFSIFGFLAVPVTYVVRSAFIKILNEDSGDTVSTSYAFIMSYRINVLMFFIGTSIGTVGMYFVKGTTNSKLIDTIEMLLMIIGSYMVSSEPKKPVRKTFGQFAHSEI